jgi:hypothetical protein
MSYREFHSFLFNNPDFSSATKHLILHISSPDESSVATKAEENISCIDLIQVLEGLSSLETLEIKGCPDDPVLIDALKRLVRRTGSRLRNVSFIDIYECNWIPKVLFLRDLLLADSQGMRNLGIMDHHGPSMPTKPHLLAHLPSQNGDNDSDSERQTEPTPQSRILLREISLDHTGTYDGRDLYLLPDLGLLLPTSPIFNIQYLQSIALRLDPDLIWRIVVLSGLRDVLLSTTESLRELSLHWPAHRRTYSRASIC